MPQAPRALARPLTGPEKEKHPAGALRISAAASGTPSIFKYTFQTPSRMLDLPQLSCYRDPPNTSLDGEVAPGADWRKTHPVYVTAEHGSCGRATTRHGVR